MSTHSRSQLSSSSLPADMPEVILNYITAANDGRVDDAAACFAADALVHDEERDHQGIDSIREWIAESTESSHPKNEILSVIADGEALAIRSRISGDFAGSPVDLDFNFVVKNGEISHLVIQ